MSSSASHSSSKRSKNPLFQGIDIQGNPLFNCSSLANIREEIAILTDCDVDTKPIQCNVIDKVRKLKTVDSAVAMVASVIALFRTATGSARRWISCASSGTRSRWALSRRWRSGEPKRCGFSFWFCFWFFHQYCALRCSQVGRRFTFVRLLFLSNAIICFLVLVWKADHTVSESWFLNFLGSISKNKYTLQYKTRGKSAKKPYKPFRPFP